MNVVVLPLVALRHGAGHARRRRRGWRQIVVAQQLLLLVLVGRVVLLGIIG
jgi:hypothetical protein